MTNSSGIDPSQAIDVAIVGGGVSGAYTGWRLVKSPENYNNVHLYELGDRIGGRLLSMPMPGMPHIYADFGGMTFAGSQAIVKNLAELLNLKVVPWLGDNPLEWLNNLLYVRNVHLRVGDVVDPSKVPYNLRYNERGLSAEQLFIYAIKSILPNLGMLSADYCHSDSWQQLRETLTVEGEKLYDISIRELLLRVLGQEAYNYCWDTGYYFNLSDWNAANSIEVNISLPFEQQWYGIENGYDQLPKTLAAQFERDGGRVHYNHRLTEFKCHESGELIELRFADRTGSCQSVLAKHLVLAMPQRSLELLYQQNRDNFLFENREFVRNLQTVTAKPASKLFLGYEYPWWRAVGVKTGISLTDLPIQECLYFGTESERAGGDPQNWRSLMLALFKYPYEHGFWSSIPDDRQATPKYPSVVSQDGLYDFQPIDASKHMVQTAQKQLAQMHGLEWIPEPYVALYLDWAKDPYGGGWYSWNPGCKPWEVAKQMRHPIPGANVYICGSCYSNVQAWVQGALNSAELMLEEHFNLKRPDWLPASYDLGS